jgi:heterodisulfide reductase subunit B
MSQDMSLTDITFFPGCSLATSAKENERSLRAFCETLGYRLVELPDWNCCGTSSAHSLDRDVAFELPARNLARVPDGGPLLVACPSCYLRLKQTHLRITQSEALQDRFERQWGKKHDPGLRIVPFLDFLAEQDLGRFFSSAGKALQGLTFVPYYGCMLARPPIMRKERSLRLVMEKVMGKLGAEPLRWRYKWRCCGTFLSVARPDIATPQVNAIMEEACALQADCIVTACSMCHLNLEVRCTAARKRPVFHFSELLALSAGVTDLDWFSRHLVDPRPLLQSKGLL